MRIKEKLAERYAGGHLEHNYEKIRDAYLAGFEKAKEIARHEVSALHSIDLSEMFYVIGVLGEEEV